MADPKDKYPRVIYVVEEMSDDESILISHKTLMEAVASTTYGDFFNAAKEGVEVAVYRLDSVEKLRIKIEAK